MSVPLVAVPADVRSFENYTWHATPDTYLKAAIRVAGVVPVIVPALLPELDLGALLARVDGVLVTGSASNVHPERYGVPASTAHEPFDPERDRLTEALIRGAVEGGLPLLAICRGHQELNVAFGGSLATEIQELEGRMDHRALPHHDQRERFAVRHPVTVAPDGKLAAIVGAGELRVNSLHRQAIDRLADGLVAEASAPDGTVEAVSVTGATAFAFGMQWHPEYWAETDEPSRRIFEAFGAACRQRREAASSR
ncbi:gamma-glutamyl-gamma-aminobutyrate hydrolase family protein [Aurantimonas sp. MSK8Z-1]|uniref:gamma-glutamyl-gamma-aminobutyrate hydrolase family protein n=1 Tax=Mangrovibrevibacter kandeliae TaxID=2968473 RepID=UPI002119AD7E|nr:gamma-glutamyl-gamma-aminobutyrate hydrolase family protein [Aurantimonas sp. MSK8Z-1]MCW4115819.1 gamma-glutamyl-gamma-aminobutyrate hydrolase family protein [Aurantimonas sp. MSK8Z-1]